MKGITILLLFFVALGANADGEMIQFRFEGEFYCHKKDFNYHVSLLEEDIFKDNFISEMPPVSSHAVRTLSEGQYVHLYKLKGEDNNDGCAFGWCDYTFEFWMKVVHDCTTDGSKMLAWFNLGYYTATSGQVNNVFYYNLTNTGKPTDDVIGQSKQAEDPDKIDVLD